MTVSTGARVAAVYDRVASVYDLYTRPMEAMGGTRARRRLFSRARGRVLELGIGTGANVPFYPPDVELVGVDISGRMLQRARRRALRGRDVALQRADIEHLPYGDASFDTVTAACVFCSVDDPVQGLREARRVTRPGGFVLLYEHVRPTNPLLARLADATSPWTRRTFGPELNRRTEENVAAAGMTVVEARRRGIWRELVVAP
ncbi:methyltransferase domain-containing protein [Kineosporiaceae bacterium SCSIO 59966]|nr:methyltransferase domain-containing protein [Kineosporiaceae bacterium SCSIO 59966]